MLSKVKTKVKENIIIIVDCTCEAFFIRLGLQQTKLILRYFRNVVATYCLYIDKSTRLQTTHNMQHKKW